MFFKKKKWNNDFYYYEAKKNKLLSRAFFKLKELDKRFLLTNKKKKILDIGYQPGSWIQYINKKCKKSNSKIIGIDTLNKKKKFPKNVTIINNNIFDINIRNFIYKNSYFDLVLSDAISNTTGMKRLDQQKSINICNKILIFALNVLQKHGSFCVKIFQGKDFLDYINLCKKKFLKVKINKPKGSRIESMEIYIICINKKN